MIPNCYCEIRRTRRQSHFFISTENSTGKYNDSHLHIIRKITWRGQSQFFTQYNLTLIYENNPKFIFTNIA